MLKSLLLAPQFASIRNPGGLQRFLPSVGMTICSGFWERGKEKGATLRLLKQPGYFMVAPFSFPRSPFTIMQCHFERRALFAKGRRTYGDGLDGETYLLLRMYHIPAI